MRDLIKELRRRNVFRVSVGYVVVAWLTAQVAELALDSFEAPAWVMKTLLLLLALGFPFAVFFAWAFELTPEGIKKEKDVDRSQSITHHTGRKLDFIIIGILVIAVSFLLSDRFLQQSDKAGASDIADTAATESVADEKSIAVLPFVDLSPAKDQEYFTDGLTENLLNALAQIKEIKVAGRTSSFAFKGQNEDLRSIGDQLNVEHILEGSVQKAGERVRVTAQLVNANDGFHLWSEVFDRNLTDIFEVQDEITGAVVLALRANILGEEAIDSAYAGNFDAYNAYLQGNYHANKRSLAAWDEAIAYYQKAIDIDPEMALAWAGLSEAIANKTGFTNQDFSKGYEEARAAANKALTLNPGLPEGYLALAGVQRSYDWDWEGAEQSLKKALALRPGDAEIRVLLGRHMSIMGDTGQALILINEANEQDPLNVDIQHARAWMLMATDRHEEALPIARALLAAHPQRVASGITLALALRALGRYQEALGAAEREPLEFLRLMMEAILYHDLGDQEAAKEKLDTLINENGDTVSYQVAAVYTTWGDFDKAFAALERGYEIRDPGLALIQSHSTFDPLRQDPRYDAFLEKMGMR